MKCFKVRTHVHTYTLIEMVNVIGIIGGGQLGAMIIEYGIRKISSDVQIRVLSDTLGKYLRFRFIPPVCLTW